MENSFKNYSSELHINTHSIFLLSLLFELLLQVTTLNLQVRGPDQHYPFAVITEIQSHQSL